MKQVVKLIFGYDGYCGDVVVCPDDMLILLSRPFVDWLYKKTWDDSPELRLKEADFHLNAFESTSHYNDEDFYFDPKDAKWLGFRVELEQHDSECEFVFTTDTINGQIRPDFDKISMSMVDKLIGVKSTINGILSQTKFKRG